jgi:cytochrome c-type biogenesis protein
MSQTPLKKAANHWWLTLVHALLFVFGFSVVFIIGWGGAATALGQLFGAYKSLIGEIGGVVVILFGLFTLRILNLPFLNYDTRPQWMPAKSGGWVSSILMGVFFAAGWTPCIGPTLGAILTLGMSQPSALQAMLLSSGYALGLGLPFIIIAIGMERAIHFISCVQRYVRWIEIASGLLLIGVGILMVTDRMAWIAIWALQHGYYLDLPLGKAVTPTYFIAVTAGLLSFLSPCVLPLVPAYIGYISGQAMRETK